MFNVNGFSNDRATAPGASSWDDKFAIKVRSSEIDKWTIGMTKVELKNYDDQWAEKIIEERHKAWKPETTPELYIRENDNVTMLVYRAEGIIFKSIDNL